MTRLRLLDTCVVSQYLSPAAPTKLPALTATIRGLGLGEAIEVVPLA